MATTIILFAIGCILVLSVMLTMNISIVVAVTRNQSLRDARNLFMCSLAISNIAVALLGGLNAFVAMISVESLAVKVVICQVSSVVQYWSWYSYVGSLFLVTTEQFLAVYKPLWHHVHLKSVDSRHARYGILTAWALLLLPVVAIVTLGYYYRDDEPTTEDKENCRNTTRSKYALIGGAVLNVAVASWYGCVHVYLVHVIRQRLAKIQKRNRSKMEQQSSDNNTEAVSVLNQRQLQDDKQRKNLNTELAAIRRLSILVISLTCTNLPDYLIPLIGIYKGYRVGNLCGAVCRLFQFLRILKISVDPFIILMNNQKLKQTVRGYFCCFRCCQVRASQYTAASQ